MIDTIKILLVSEEVKLTWDILKLKQRLEPYTEFHRGGVKPFGRIRNFRISGNNSYLIIEGSLAKYFNGDNIRNLDWKDVKQATRMLSKELGLPIERGLISRIDIGANFKMEFEPKEYFPELKHLRYFDSIERKETTLRFEHDCVNVKFYDKSIQSKKLIADVDEYRLEKLMRFEISIQDRLARYLKMKKARAVQLYSPTFYKKLLEFWFETYCSIEKKAVLILPPHLKGRAAFSKFKDRYFVETLGWRNVENMLNVAIREGCLTPDDKSKILKQFRTTMADNENFVFDNKIIELNQKVKQKYDNETLQIELIQKGYYNIIRSKN